jgi:ATP-dependent protease ClpP protease subunit
MRLFIGLLTALLLVNTVYGYTAYVWVRGGIGQGTKEYSCERLIYETSWAVKQCPSWEVVDGIVYVITSPGGSIYETYTMIDYIDLLRPKYTIYTIASGYCMSAAVLLLQAGDIRMAQTGTLFMTHSPLLCFQDKIQVTSTDMVKYRNELKDLNQEMIDYIAWRMEKKPKKIAWMFTDKEYYFKAKEAFQRGFVDAYFWHGMWRYSNDFKEE